MTRFLENGLAALAAVTLFAVSFSAMVSIPADPSFMVAATSLPILA